MLCSCLLISFPTFYSRRDVGVLPPFASTTQQDDNAPAFTREVHTVARPEIQPQFKDPLAQRPCSAEVACLKPADVSVHPFRCDRVQGFIPLRERRERPASVYSRISKDPFI